MLFTHGTPNIAGCLFGLSGLSLYFYQIIYINWLPIIIGLYVVGYRITPTPPEILHVYNKTLSPDELMITLETLIVTVRNKIPESILTIVLEIRNELENIVQRFSHIEQDPNSHHVIHQTVVDYLPRVLDTYMKIPPAYAKLYKMRDGSTATDLAIEQLQILSSEISHISKSIAKKDIQDLKTHHRFLKEKFNTDIDDWFV